MLDLADQRAKEKMKKTILWNLQINANVLAIYVIAYSQTVIKGKFRIHEQGNC
jgi:hypothetical protein